MSWGNEKTFKVVYISKKDWDTHVILVQASDKGDASIKAQKQLTDLHTIQDIEEV